MYGENGKHQKDDRWMIFMIYLDEVLDVPWLSSMCLSVCLSVFVLRFNGYELGYALKFWCSSLFGCFV